MELKKPRNISRVQCSPRNLNVNQISQISLLVAFLSRREYLGTDGDDNGNPGVLVPRRVSPNTETCVSLGTSSSSALSATTLFSGLGVPNSLGSGSGNTRQSLRLHQLLHSTALSTASHQTPRRVATSCFQVLRMDKTSLSLGRSVPESTFQFHLACYEPEQARSI